MKNRIIQLSTIVLGCALLFMPAGCKQNGKPPATTEKAMPPFEKMALTVRLLTRDLHSSSESVRRKTVVSLIELASDQSEFESSDLPRFLFAGWGFMLDQGNADPESMVEFEKMVTGIAAWIGTDLDAEVKTMLYGMSGVTPTYKTTAEFMRMWETRRTGIRAAQQGNGVRGNGDSVQLLDKTKPSETRTPKPDDKKPKP